jgi:serine/threonine protein kinase
MQMRIITAVHVLNPLMIYILLFCMVMGWASSNKLKLQLLMLEQMRHPNIVQFLCAVTRSQPIVIVTEYLPGVNLFFSHVWMEQQVGENSVMVLLAVDF